MSNEGLVIIRPRVGVTAEEVAHWLEHNFQKPDQFDAGPRAPGKDRKIYGGNPLVNASVKVVEGV